MPAGQQLALQTGMPPHRPGRPGGHTPPKADIDFPERTTSSIPGLVVDASSRGARRHWPRPTPMCCVPSTGTEPPSGCHVRDETTWAEPDVAIWPAGDVDLAAGRPTPELVADVLSPSSVLRDRRDKPDLYAQAGVPWFVLADPAPDSATIVIYRLNADGHHEQVASAVDNEPLRCPPTGADLTPAIIARGSRSRRATKPCAIDKGRLRSHARRSSISADRSTNAAIRSLERLRTRMTKPTVINYKVRSEDGPLPPDETIAMTYGRRRGCHLGGSDCVTISAPPWGECAIHGVGGVLQQCRHHTGVSVHGQLVGAVAEDLHHDPCRHSLSKQQRRSCMPRVIEAVPRHTGVIL